MYYFAVIKLPRIFFYVEMLITLPTKKILQMQSFLLIIIFLMTVRVFWDISVTQYLPYVYTKLFVSFCIKGLSTQSKVSSKQYVTIIMSSYFGLCQSPNLFLQLQMWTKVPYFKCEQKFHILHSFNNYRLSNFINMFF